MEYLEVSIQDPVQIQLYTPMGTIKKGGVDVKVYRCARGLGPVVRKEINC